MRTLIAILLAACASGAQAQFNQTYNTCNGANDVTQMDAGGISLPNKEVVIEVDTGTPEYAYSHISVTPATAGIDLFMGICEAAPGPVSPCTLLLDYGVVNEPEVMPNLPRGHYYIIVEGTNGGTASCGEFQLVQQLPLG